jgi:tetratricopeptide (TPR) repeat protein
MTTSLCFRSFLAVTLLGWFVGASPAQTLSADQQAALMLNSAHRAYNDKNFALAADRFRALLKEFPYHPNATSARLGLAMSLWELPNRDLSEMTNLLRPIADAKDSPDRPLALYHIALVQRVQPTPADSLQQAARLFGEAAVAFLPASPDWSARARCEQAETLLRARLWKESAAASEPFLTDPNLARSPHAKAARYYYGYALFRLQQYNAAGRVLSELAPFDDPQHGPHTRYLLARVHHLAGERPEAAALYETIISDKSAEFAPRAMFYLAAIRYEQERFTEALERFSAISQPPLSKHAAVRAGMCQVQLQQYEAALQTLSPLQDDREVADLARLWMARGILADPKTKDTKPALEHLRKASELAGPNTRADVMLELADAQTAARQFAEAARTCEQILAAKPDGERSELALLRLAANRHLAGQFDESDEACRQFQQWHPKSARLDAILFRQAENALARAAAAKSPEKFADAIEKYQLVIRSPAGSVAAHRARYGQAVAYYQLGRYADARDALSAIPANERSGDLDGVPSLLAECLLRSAPVRVDDAISAGRALRQLTEAAAMWEAAARAAGDTPAVADLMVKLGLCRQRIAELIAEPKEREAAMQLARQTFEQVKQKFPQHPLVAVSELERYRTMALAGDVDGAMQRLPRFLSDPLKDSKVAPLALLRWAALLRSQGKAVEAAKVLADCRASYEAGMAADPARKDWVPLIRYHQALALNEAGKRAEAQLLWESIVQDQAGALIALESAWRIGQTKREEAAGKPDARQRLEETSRYLSDQAATARGRAGTGSAAQLWLWYEAAWCERELGNVDRAREFYRNAMGGNGDEPVALRSALELAEMEAGDERWVEAAHRLTELLERELSAELADRARVRLGMCRLGLGDWKSALAAFNPVADDPGSPMFAEARFWRAETWIRTKAWDAAVKALTAFREHEKLRDVAGLSDRALLRLGQARAELKQWDESRQAFEDLRQRFPQSRWMAEAFYGIGWALQNKGQWDAAVEAYVQVTKRTVTEVAARAQLQIGLCRLAQNRFEEAANALLVVPTTYDYPNLAALARCEAARAWATAKRPEQAADLLRQVMKENPGTEWSAMAEERLALLK